MVQQAAIYEHPPATTILTIASFLFLINVAEALFEWLINAGLIGSLIVGVIYGPQVADILPHELITSLIQLGYIGLLILVFEAGLTTNTQLLIDNLFLSTVAACVGIGVPIGLSMLLLHVGYGYTLLQSFAAGAALSSTSLGTTLALLKPEWRQMRAGAVLLSAALLDDIVGLVIAAIISQLADTNSDIPWQIIVQPILVSMAFAILVPLLAYLLNRAHITYHVSQVVPKMFHRRSLLFVVVAVLSGLVAGARYAGTSDLFGAYLAGILLNFLAKGYATEDAVLAVEEQKSTHSHPPSVVHEGLLTSTFTQYILPALQTFLYPIFFASIGIALPIRALGVADGSSAVIWRGVVYAILMFLAKAVVGLTILLWPAPKITEVEAAVGHLPPTLTRPQASVFLGLAMVARGEIALIVAQLARPILTHSGESEEAYAVVIWAILLCTVGGAICVGVFLRSRSR
ncbi:Hsp70 ATPase ssc1 [Pleurotus pulmonarius]|nr:Hsp70 ATPase ssc1 [Pleurotus pulmonarius]KAF4607875.1 Hsp70 ATPase ssc1 [Pleurotus pulmonarius]